MNADQPFDMMAVSPFAAIPTPEPTMPAYPRPGDTSQDDEGEGAAWAKAFDTATPDPDNAPLTDEERGTLRDLMIAAAERGDHDSIDKLAALEDQPTAFRKLMKDAAGDQSDKAE